MDAKLQAVTSDEVNAAFRSYIDPDRLAIVKAGISEDGRDERRRKVTSPCRSA